MQLKRSDDPVEQHRTSFIKERCMPRYRKYSWQVAPQQSLLALFSGKTNIGKAAH
jgi:hypothetical protein